GSAHLVLPLTEDTSLIQTYTDALATRIMPVAGKDTTKAVALAEATLSKESAAGTILFITDGIEESAFDALKRAKNGTVIVLAIGTAAGGAVKKPDGGFLNDAANGRVFAKLDLDGLKRLHARTGVEVATSTDDDTDVRWVAQRIRSDFTRKQSDDGNRWRDMGWWIVVPLVVLFGLSFRKGWVVRMGAALLALRLLQPTSAAAADFMDMWLTPDQQGRRSFEHGDYAGAASHFSDPMWKGVALYKAGKFAEAVDAFASVDTAESWYDQGNSLLHLSMPEEAVAAYQKALQMRKDWPDAVANLAVAEKLLKAKKDEEEEQQEPSEKPDQIQFDDKGKQGKEGKIDIAEQTSEMWMKNIQISPTDLMARKFASEAGEKKP
ncbi:MAG: hypothetical protein KGI75_31840, partial [Rhizobiaceae bacterium]|nr:hypothetical protein [Rhizobiaceae bacterium]